MTDVAQIHACSVCKRPLRSIGPGQECPYCGGPAVVHVGVRYLDEEAERDAATADLDSLANAWAEVERARARLEPAITGPGRRLRGLEAGKAFLQVLHAYWVVVKRSAARRHATKVEP